MRVVIQIKLIIVYQLVQKQEVLYREIHLLLLVNLLVSQLNKKEQYQLEHLLKQTAGEPVSLGMGAGQTNLASGSIVVGYEAGQQGTGTESVAIGYKSGSKAATTVAVGAYAGQSSTGDSSISIGVGAGQTKTSSNQISMGVNAGRGKTQGVTYSYW